MVIQLEDNPMFIRVAHASDPDCGLRVALDVGFSETT